MDFDIKEKQNEDITILELYGYLDASSAPQLDKKLNEVLNQGKIKLIINMKGLNLISSAGWSIFVEMTLQFKKKGGDIRLAEMRNDAKNIFNIMGLDAVIKSFESIEKALESFKKQ
mgnify:CR=1 FL=1|jgi:anti-anti-sigma factor